MALTTAFAKNGNRKAVPQSTADGSVSYEQGFGNLYALPPEEGGLFIDRAQFNQILYDTTSAVISNQNSINTLNSKVTANQNSINTLNSKVANIEGGVATGVVNLTTNQNIGGVKTFSVPPVSATQPTNANQVANKAYVDSVGNSKVATTTYNADKATFATKTELNSKANFVTKSVKIGANETLKTLKDFQNFTLTDFAHYYRITLTSDIIEDEALLFRGINCGFSSSNYTITFNQVFDIHYSTLVFGDIKLKLNNTPDIRINFLSSNFYINGNVTFTDLVTQDTAESPQAISLIGSNFMTGGDDDWNITTNRNFIGLSGSRAQIVNIDFTGSIPQVKNLFAFNQQGLLMTQKCNFGNLTVTDIAQNQLTNKGIWFNI